MARKRNSTYLERQIRKLHREIEELTENSEMGWDKIYYTKKSAAAVLGISYRTLDRWNISGNIKRTIIAGRIYYSKREVLRVAQLYIRGIGYVSDYAVGYLSSFEEKDDFDIRIEQ